MTSIPFKLYKSIRTVGVRKTIANANRYVINTFYSVERRFTWIHDNNRWRNEESVSGPGSTLEYTRNLREKLPELISNLSVKDVFDGPCGDFNWMRDVLKDSPVNYVGGDVVSGLVDSNNAKYGSDRVKFFHVDLIKGPFPKSDLMICRDCLFHLSYKDTKDVLLNFVNSGIPYLLTTTHINRGQFKNSDIQTGGFRQIDLFSDPYNFPIDPLFRIDDWTPPDRERQMCLWSRDQIADPILRMK